MIQDVNVGTLPNDGTGDLLRDAFIILNNNIQELVDKDTLLDSDISSINTLLGSLQTQINGKAPLLHSHIISDITGLQTILDGKVDETAYISDIATINTSINNILTTLSGLGAVATSNDYNDLDNIPTSFIPSYHTHTEADISDLDKYTQLEVDTMFDALGDLANLDQVDTAQIVTHAVTNTKLAQMNANTVKGRLSGNGTPQDISMLDLPISTATQTALDLKLDNLTWVDYSTLTTTVGWSSFTQKRLWYLDFGSHILLYYHLVGNGSGINSSFTAPFNATQESYSQHIAMSNGGFFNNPGRGQINSGSNVVNLYATIPGSTWSAGTATKIASGIIIYKK